MKTKTAWNTFSKNGKITCTSTGEKDHYGKEIWRDQDGKAYELKYARLAGIWAFLRYSCYDLWYAVQETYNDEWGYGSHNLEEAKEMLRKQGYGLIAVIENNVCIKEITIEEVTA